MLPSPSYTHLYKPVYIVCDIYYLLLTISCNTYPLFVLLFFLNLLQNKIINKNNNNKKITYLWPKSTLFTT